MNKARRLHNEAMDYAESAYCNQKEAALRECEAARLIPKEDELTRSVFYKSAAILCADANMLSLSETLIKEAREGNVPTEIEEELKHVEELITLYRKMKGE